MADIPLRRVEQDVFTNELGTFCWSADGNRLRFGCPHQKSQYCGVPVAGPGTHWEFDGNREQPTLSPSIHCIADEGSAGCGWHGWIQGGVMRNV